MGLLDTFFVSFKADTKSVDKALDDTTNRAKKTREQVQQKAKQAIDQLNTMGKNSAKPMNEAEKGASRLANALERVKTAGSAAGKGLSAAGGAAATIGRAGVGALAGGAGVGGLLAGGGAIALLAASITTAIALGFKEAEKARALKKEAWGAGLSELEALRQIEMGKRLGVQQEQVMSQFQGVADMVMQVRTHRFNLARTGGLDTDPTSRMLRSRGIDVSMNRTAEEIHEALLKDVRKAAKSSRGANYALARGVQQYGMDFDYLSKVIAMTDDQFKNLTKSLNADAAAALDNHLKAKQLAEQKRVLSAELDRTAKTVGMAVVPSLTNLMVEFNKTAVQGRTLADVVADVASGFVDLITKMLKGINQMRQEANNKAKEDQFLEEGIQAAQKAGLLKTERGKISHYGMETVEPTRAYFERLSPEEKVSVSKLGSEAMAKSDAGIAQAKKTEEADKIGKNYVSIAKQQGKGDKVDAINKAIEEFKQSGSNDTDELIGRLNKLIQVEASGMSVLTAKSQAANEKLAQIAQYIGPGLEQAIALWSAGVGRAGGMGVKEGDYAGQTRAEWEVRSKPLMYASDVYKMRQAGAVARKVEANRQNAQMAETVIGDNSANKTMNVKMEFHGAGATPESGQWQNKLRDVWKDVSNSLDSAFKN